jgi:Predicted aminopeptidases
MPVKVGSVREPNYSWGKKISVIAGTYSSSCEVEAGFAAAGNVFELENGNFRGKIAVIYGELTQAPLAAKHCSVYNPETHKRIVGLLEAKKPLAIVAVSHRMVNPVPILEDWDFKIPSVTVSTIDGMKLLKNAEGSIKLILKTKFEASHAANVVGKYGKNEKEKLVFCAHLDTKYGTNGAADNGTGVVVLLMVAELLKDRLKNKALPFDLEFAALNGEEYHALGEMLYIEKNLQNFGNMLAAINIDGVGHYSSTSNLAFFDCPEEFVNAALDLREKYPGIIRVDPWPAGDYIHFWMRKILSVAIGSTGTCDLFHTADDMIDLISIDKIEEVVRLVVDLVIYIIADRLEDKEKSGL